MKWTKALQFITCKKWKKEIFQSILDSLAYVLTQMAILWIRY